MGELSQGDGLKVVLMGIGRDGTPYTLNKEISPNESPLISVFGMPGTGKSQFIKGWILQWPGKIIILDREGEFHDLIRFFPNSIILDPHTDRDPLIRCQEVDDSQALNDFKDVLQTSTEMFMSGEWLRVHIEGMIKEGLRPTLHEIDASIDLLKKRTFGYERAYMDRAGERIKALCARTGLGDCVDCVYGFSPERVLEYDLIIFDISELSENDAYTYASMKMMHFFRYAESHRFEERLLWVFDEGSYFFSKKRSEKHVMALPHEIIANRSRKRGFTIMVAGQMVTDFSDHCLNPSMMVCFALKSKEQQKAVAGSLGMKEEEAVALGDLPPRTCFVRF